MNETLCMLVWLEYSSECTVQWITPYCTQLYTVWPPCPVLPAGWPSPARVAATAQSPGGLHQALGRGDLSRHPHWAVNGYEADIQASAQHSTDQSINLIIDWLIDENLVVVAWATDRTTGLKGCKLIMIHPFVVWGIGGGRRYSEGGPRRENGRKDGGRSAEGRIGSLSRKISRNTGRAYSDCGRLLKIKCVWAECRAEVWIHYWQKWNVNY